MSSRIRCQRCGSAHYSASAAAMIARGERCGACGGALELSREAQWRPATQDDLSASAAGTPPEDPGSPRPTDD